VGRKKPEGVSARTFFKNWDGIATGGFLFEERIAVKTQG